MLPCSVRSWRVRFASFSHCVYLRVPSLSSKNISFIMNWFFYWGGVGVPVEPSRERVLIEETLQQIQCPDDGDDGTFTQRSCDFDFSAVRTVVGCEMGVHSGIREISRHFIITRGTERIFFTIVGAQCFSHSHNVCIKLNSTSGTACGRSLFCSHYWAYNHYLTLSSIISVQCSMPATFSVKHNVCLPSHTKESYIHPFQPLKQLTSPEGQLSAIKYILKAWHVCLSECFIFHVLCPSSLFWLTSLWETLTEILLCSFLTSWHV
jgi:hypothetical protein